MTSRDEDFRRAARAVAKGLGDSLYRAGDWLATQRDDVVLGVHLDTGDVAAVDADEARGFDVSAEVFGRTDIPISPGSPVTVEAYEVKATVGAALGGGR